MERILVSWSGGKDSAMTLYALIREKTYNIAALLTTVTQDYDRISMHGVRRSLLERQAVSLGFPLEIVWISKQDSCQEYESKMHQALEKYVDRGVLRVASGDIFLQDLRRYREENLSKIGMKGVFPLWERSTRELAHGFIASGFGAVVSCVDSRALSKGFAGRAFDEAFLGDLPQDVDPCGENGEFHTFVYDGPIFKKRISYSFGEMVLRDDRFYFSDLIPE